MSRLIADLAAALAATASARSRVWTLLDPDATAQLIIDRDANLVTAYFGTDYAAANYKVGYGFHTRPLNAITATDGVTTMILRPGNARENHAADCITTLDHALTQIPRWHRGPAVRSWFAPPTSAALTTS
ncbi:hypothetical protein [Gordonia malaquae]|uniref:hypothetical protein n=1 Tax=Gordonia malaquae TaxID=410332 RepID=UPI0030FE9588